MQIPPFNNQWLRAFETPWLALSSSPSIYEWARNCFGLIPVRANCSKPCWMSDAASTEWKSYSRPHYNYVAWLPGSRQLYVFKSATLGTSSLYESGRVQYEMSTQARKSVKRLSMSRSLTSDVWNERLTLTHVSAMRRLSRSDCVFEDSRRFVRTFSRWSRSGSLNQVWTDDGWLVSKRELYP